MKNHLLRKIIATTLITLTLSPITYADITVAAAASLTNALTDISQNYQKERGVKVSPSFASSATLAKQIDNGLPTDVFISADQQWMDTLDNQGKIDGRSRRNLVGNTLVLIAPKGQGFKVSLSAGTALADAFAGKLCTGETDTVPVGIYAKQALQHLGVWETLKMRVVGTQDVRAALAFVERGECSAGIVYATDARISNKVDTVASFPRESHAPIVYPAALVSQAQEARDFLQYLSEPAAQAIFVRYGFTVLNP